MEFCPECGAMLLPKDNKLACKCGYVKDLTETETKQYAVDEKVESKNNVIMRGEDINTHPTTIITCPECGHNKAAWWLQQTRSADEAPTRFFQCLKCKHTWREYD